MHSFEVHSSESACRKSGSLGLEQVKNSPLLRLLVNASARFSSEQKKIDIYWSVLNVVTGHEGGGPSYHIIGPNGALD